MARKPKHEEHENHERWLISYADFITLLFAFFVVMYSVSSVNEGKYRVLSDALVAAFRAPAKSVTPIQVGSTAKAPISVEFSIRKSPTVIRTFDRPLPSPHSNAEKKEQAPQSTPQPKTPPQPQSKDNEHGQGQRQTASEAAAAIQKMANDIEHAMQSLIDNGTIKVRRSTFWLEVEINTSILYSSGSARLESGAVPVLQDLAKILTPFPNQIHVEGFTDNVPISTLTFPSNWELSAARAASVVTLFAKVGVEPTRMAAIGFGQYRPAADNDTEQGRTKNRRVVVVVLSSVDKSEAKKDAAPQQLQQELNAPPEAPPAPASGAAPTGHAAPVAPVAPTAPAARMAPVAPAAAPVTAAPHAPGEPVDVTSQPVTAVGRFPIIDLPIAVPLPATAAQPAK